MAPKSTALGDYLRARRQQVLPEEVGLIPGERRRVAGLRREELAMLAGRGIAIPVRARARRSRLTQLLEASARGTVKTCGPPSRRSGAAAKI